jgi:glycosyltransferase involved in cell wall biosynthesis
MRILHLAPLWSPIGRDSLGGIETFLAALLAGLERTGCQNTVLATGDSRTAAELLPVTSEGLIGRMAAGTALEYYHYEQHQLLLALDRGPQFDVVHSHLGPRGLFLSGVPGLRVLHTWHTQVYRDMEWFVAHHPELWLCAVSEFQARALRQAGAGRCSVVHNGIDVAAFPFAEAGGADLLFVGRIEHAKGVDLAIRVARTLDRALTLAGPIVDREFFARAIEPELDGQVRYIGTLDHRAKTEMMGQSACVLMPSRVHEACGLVAMEAMACGTPVVALANGALPELIERDLTGYVSDDTDALPNLVQAAVKLDRRQVRERVSNRFDIGAVADRYLNLYRAIVAAADHR